MVDEAAKAAGLFKRNAGEETTIYVPDAITRDGRKIDFISAMLDNIKHGETRGFNTHLPVNKWIGLAKDGKVYGRVKFGNPVVITRDSEFYSDALIEGTDYGLNPGEAKQYYPIIDTMDLRDNPRDIVRNGNYGVYQFKSLDPVTYDDNGDIIPLSERFRTDRTGEEEWKNSDIRYSRKDADIDYTNPVTAREYANMLTKAGEALDRENRALRKSLEYWKGQTKRTKEATVRSTDVSRYATRLIKETGAKVEQAQVKDMLMEIGNYLVQRDSETMHSRSPSNP